MRQRLDFQVHDAELAAAAGLADEPAFGTSGRRDRLLERDLRPADVRIDVELAQHAVDDDLKVQLAHAGDDRLAGLLVVARLERRVLLHQARQAVSHPLLVVLRLRLDRHRNHRLRELYRLQNDWKRIVRKRVPCERVLQPDRRRDLPRRDAIDILSPVRMHPQNPPEPLSLATCSVVQHRPLLRHPRIHPKVHQPPDIRVRDNLKRQRRKRLVLPRLADHRFPIFGIRSRHRRDLER